MKNDKKNYWGIQEDKAITAYISAATPAQQWKYYILFEKKLRKLIEIIVSRYFIYNKNDETIINDILTHTLLNIGKYDGRASWFSFLGFIIKREAYMILVSNSNMGVVDKHKKWLVLDEIPEHFKQDEDDKYIVDNVYDKYLIQEAEDTSIERLDEYFNTVAEKVNNLVQLHQRTLQRYINYNYLKKDILKQQRLVNKYLKQKQYVDYIDDLRKNIGYEIIGSRKSLSQHMCVNNMNVATLNKIYGIQLVNIYNIRKFNKFN